MKLQDRIAVFDRDSKLLQEIASSYSEQSEEVNALRRATKALWYVLRQGHDFQRAFGEADDRTPAPAPKKLPSDADGDAGFKLDVTA